MPRKQKRAGDYQPKPTVPGGGDFTHWVLLCPHCDERKLTFWPGKILPELLTCEICTRTSATAAWRVAFMEYQPTGKTPGPLTFGR